MESQSPSLGDKIARLRGAAQVEENGTWLPDPLHALIMACLARLFGRLEQILQFWQTGAPPAHDLGQRPISATSTSAESDEPHEYQQENQRLQRPRAKTTKSRLAPLASSSWRLGVKITGLMRCEKPIPDMPATNSASPANPHRRSARAPPAVKPIANAPWQRRTRTP